ncbi:MAG: toxin-antitoxin system toxin subunit [Ruminococcus flavefaciens]|nr:toxin-antitoxin system toxin subunit [Ruminococcus flavefaciens]
MFNTGNTLTIIEIAAREDGCHGMQSQSGRTECWMEGWIAVPAEMCDAIWETKGYCELDIQDGVLVGFTPIAMPAALTDDLPVEPTEVEKLAARVDELEARLAALENGGNA